MRHNIRQSFLVIVGFGLLLVALLGGQFYSDASPLKASALFQSPMPTLPNDNFTRAQPINSLPFVVPANLNNATIQSGEPLPSCAYSDFGKTLWYAYSPTSNGALMASLEGWDGQVIGIYTGGTLRDLVQVGCVRTWNSTSFVAQAGVTYYFQVGGNSGFGGDISFRLNTPPPPVADFSPSPSDPSIYEVAYFNSYIYDPVGMAITSVNWNFGDGSKATGLSPSHQYAVDGDYPVKLTVKTSDGRIGSKTKTVMVRTRDVYITKLVRPRTAVTGQTKRIVVTLGNQRYPQTVRVDLLRSVPGGYMQLGSLTQFVDINRTTDFYFGYTFTSSDTQVGKVTFKAIASIVDGYDALSGDNEFISLPVIVTAPTGRSAEETMAVDDLSLHEADLESNEAADGPLVTEATEATVIITKDEANQESAPVEGPFQIYMPVIRN